MSTPYQRMYSRIEQGKYEGDGIDNLYNDLLKFYDLEDSKGTQGVYIMAWQEELDEESGEDLYEVLALFDDLVKIVELEGWKV